MAEAMRKTVANIVKGVEKYETENLRILENYVEIQAKENVYDLEANLAVLELYRLDPKLYNVDITSKILLKALTQLPETDFFLCKCFLSGNIISEQPVKDVIHLGDILEHYDFHNFWEHVHSMPDVCNKIFGFQDSIRNFVCYVVGRSFATIGKTFLSQLLGNIDDNIISNLIEKYGWKEDTREGKKFIFIANEGENISNKNNDIENLADLMASCL